MSTDTKKNKFEAAKKKRKEQKEKDASYEGGGSFEEIVYTALSPNEDKVIRIIGDPMLVREKGTDPKLSMISMILGDNGKKFRCIWPNKQDDSSWILWKIYDKVMSYDWDRTNNVKRFHFVDSHPETFRRVAKNNSENQYEQGWRPSKVVHMNIIDRHDMEWHREQSHLKVLSKKASEYGDGRVWFEPGVPEFLYSKIWDDVVEYSGDWNNYDIVVRKLTEQPWYSAYHGLDDRKKLHEGTEELIVDADLTEEEMTWEGYDFDTLFPVTSYSKIKNRLGKFIKKVDLDFDTNYYEELEDLVAIEEKERKEEKKNNPKKVVNEDEDEEIEEDVDLDINEDEEEEEEKTETPPPTRTRKTATRQKSSTTTVDWDSLADGSLNGTQYLGVPEMTEEEKSMVASVKEDGSFEYVKEWNGNKVSLLNNPSSDFISPEEFHIDPLSGELFD